MSLTGPLSAELPDTLEKLDITPTCECKKHWGSAELCGEKAIALADWVCPDCAEKGTLYYCGKCFSLLLNRQLTHTVQSFEKCIYIGHTKVKS